MSALSFGGGEQCIEWARHFRLDDQRIASHLGQHLSARESDLLDIAAAVYVADRTTARAAAPGFTWGRDFELRIAVRDVGFWSAAANSAHLKAFLDWLTDDRWEITFTGNVRWRRPAEAQPPLFTEPLPDSARVGLYSGGLDSVAGAARDLADGTGLVLVSASTMGALARLQRRTISALSSASSTEIRSVIVPIQLIGPALQARGLSKNAETTQRSRGFVFLALGLITAMTSGLDELRVYENGIGAINLPQAELQLGSMTTRAMHPRTLELAGALASAVAERVIRVVNPSFAYTKAELLQMTPRSAAEAAALSLSCDTSLTNRRTDRAERPLCGACTSCILRRQALRAGGWQALDAAELPKYRVDCFGPAPAHRETLAMHDMLGQAWRIAQAVDAPDPWASLVEAFPAITRARRALGEQGPNVLVRLLRAYADEWRRDPAQLARRYFGREAAA